MAQLKDLVVTGASRLIGDTYTSKIQITAISAPTASNGTTYGPGTNGQILKSNGTSIYWADNNDGVTGVKGNSESSYRTGNVNLTPANIGALALSGGTMTGTLTAQSGVYTDAYTGALNMNNSNIYGLNSIYTADTSDNAGEGIHFYRDATHVDTLWMNGGDLLFVPNRVVGTGTTKADSQKVARFTANPTTGQVVVTDGTTGGVKTTGYTIAASVPSGAVFTDTWKALSTSQAGYVSQAPNSTIKFLRGDATWAQVSEASLIWGGQNFSGNYGCLDAAMIQPLGANRFAFLKAAGLTIEYSTDGGSTWTDYDATAVQKTGLFGAGQSFVLGKHSTAGTNTVNDQLRVTIDTGAAGIYTVLNKIAIYMSTSGNTVSVKLEKALQNAPTTYTTHLDWTDISGWFGWNILNISGITTYGNTASSQYGRLRFTFRQTAVNTNYASANISRIMGFGGMGWTVPSNLARDGHLYSYDNSQNATFPAEITATKFNGNATSATKVGHKLTIGSYEFDGSADVTIPIYDGATS